jgi:hypothetical protein
MAQKYMDPTGPDPAPDTHHYRLVINFSGATSVGSSFCITILVSNVEVTGNGRPWSWCRAA